MESGNIHANLVRLVPTTSTVEPSSGAKLSGGQGPTFGSMLEGILKETSELQGQADGEIQELVAGNKTNVQEVLLAVAKADLSFKLMLEVRNKLLEAYTEVMRMQV